MFIRQSIFYSTCLSPIFLCILLSKYPLNPPPPSPHLRAIFQHVLTYFSLLNQSVYKKKLRVCVKNLHIKELSFCHKLRFSYSYNLATCFSRPLIFQTINSGRSSSLSLKYQRFTPSGCKDIGVRKYKFVAKTQFLWQICLNL